MAKEEKRIKGTFTARNFNKFVEAHDAIADFEYDLFHHVGYGYDWEPREEDLKKLPNDLQGLYNAYGTQEKCLLKMADEIDCELEVATYGYNGRPASRYKGKKQPPRPEDFKITAELLDNGIARFTVNQRFPHLYNSNPAYKWAFNDAFAKAFEEQIFDQSSGRHWLFELRGKQLWVITNYSNHRLLRDANNTDFSELVNVIASACSWSGDSAIANSFVYRTLPTEGENHTEVVIIPKACDELTFEELKEYVFV